MSGVINIITKIAATTHGGFIEGGAGTGERGFSSVRYGNAIGEESHVRVTYVPSQKQTWWAAVSRAVRSSNFSSEGVRLDIGFLPLAEGEVQFFRHLETIGLIVRSSPPMSLSIAPLSVTD